MISTGSFELGLNCKSDLPGHGWFKQAVLCATNGYSSLTCVTFDNVDHIIYKNVV